MTTLLVPLDGSELANRAVPFAAAIAARGGWSILLLRAVNTLSAPTVATGVAQMQEAQAALDVVAASLATDGLIVMTRVEEKQPETAILDATADENVSMVVMSTHGRGGLGRFIYGSVADTVVRHAPVPVLTVPPHGLAAWPTDRRFKILVPLDGSPLSRAALGPACELADVLGGTLVLATVVTFPYYAAYAEGVSFVEPDPDDSLLREARQELETIADGLRTETRQVEVFATYGSPYFGISTVAHEVGAAAIVMATHGRGGLTRAVLGSVATAIVHQAEVPIVLVRPDEAEQAPETPEAAAPAIEQPASVAEPAEAGQAIALSLSAEELEMLKSVVGARFYGEPVDPSSAEPMRLLLEKLRTARVAPADEASAVLAR